MITIRWDVLVNDVTLIPQSDLQNNLEQKQHKRLVSQSGEEEFLNENAVLQLFETS